MAAVLLAGCGDRGQIRVDRSAVDFGEVYVGTTATPKTMTWTNEAATALRVDRIALDSASTAFAFVAVPPGELLRPKQTMTAHVGFTPTSEGTVTATAEPRSDREVVGSTVSLRGTGRAQITRGALYIHGGNLTDGKPMDFGPVRIGQTERRYFIINNRSAQTLTLRGRTYTNGTFFRLASPAMPVTIPANGQLTVTIEFTPRRAGPVTDAFIIETDGGVNAAGTALTGGGRE